MVLRVKGTLTAGFCVVAMAAGIGIGSGPAWADPDPAPVDPAVVDMLEARNLADTKGAYALKGIVGQSDAGACVWSRADLARPRFSLTTRQYSTAHARPFETTKRTSQAWR